MLAYDEDGWLVSSLNTARLSLSLAKALPFDLVRFADEEFGKIWLWRSQE